MSEALKREAQIEALARELSKAKDVLYLGRGTSYPLALEGALKLKEISYIHAEGYAAGELKHGPIALIDETMPVIVIAPHDQRVREDRVEHAGGRGARRAHHPDHRRQGRAGDRARRPMATIVMPSRASRRRADRPRRSRCSFSPTTRPCSWGKTSTSRATSPSRSRSSEGSARSGARDDVRLRPRR